MARSTCRWVTAPRSTSTPLTARYDGFIRNVVRNEDWGGQHSRGVRAKLLWEPSDSLSVYVIGDYSRVNRRGPGQLWTLNSLDASLTAQGGRVGLPFVNLAARSA